MLSTPASYLPFSLLPLYSCEEANEIPCPQSLASVPVFSGLTNTTFTAPPQTTQVTWAAGNPNLLPPSYGTWPQPTPQPGVTLSPAGETFPRKFVDKVRSGQYIDMKELLADNVSLLSQLEAIQGPTAAHMLGPTRPRLREVSSLPTWCYCFLGYVALRTTDQQTRDQLAYARLLIKEAQRHGGLGYLDYDKAFRQQAAGDPALRWNTLIPGLQASTMLGHRPVGQGMFCTLCRAVDHTRAQCALICLEPSTPVTTMTSRPLNRRRPASICTSWNRGTCIYPGQCNFKHMCSTCQSWNHKAKDCPKASDMSNFRPRADNHRPRPPATAPPTTQ